MNIAQSILPHAGNKVCYESKIEKLKRWQSAEYKPRTPKYGLSHQWSGIEP